MFQFLTGEEPKGTDGPTYFDSEVARAGCCRPSLLGVRTLRSRKFAAFRQNKNKNIPEISRRF
jgi:hypothetical protein